MAIPPPLLPPLLFIFFFNQATSSSAAPGMWYSRTPTPRSSDSILPMEPSRLLLSLPVQYKHHDKMDRQSKVGDW
jgi:hypothetical protein